MDVARVHVALYLPCHLLHPCHASQINLVVRSSGILDSIFYGLHKSEARGSRRNTITSASPTTVKGKEKAKAMLRHLHSRKGPQPKGKEPTHSDGASLRLRKVVPGTSFQPSKNSNTQRTKKHTIEKKEHPHSEEGTKCSTKPTTRTRSGAAPVIAGIQRLVNASAFPPRSRKTTAKGPPQPRDATLPTRRQ